MVGLGVRSSKDHTEHQQQSANIDGGAVVDEKLLHAIQ